MARFARAVEDGEPVLVPDAPDLPVQAIDVRDLAGVAGRLRARRRTVGTYNASGPVLRFGGLHRACRAQVAGHDGPVVLVDPDWLATQRVEEFMGPDSVALWLHDPEWAGFSSRDTAATRRTGLSTRPLAADPRRHAALGARARAWTAPRKAGLSRRPRRPSCLAAWSAR